MGRVVIENKLGDVGGKGGIEEADGLGAFLDGGDGAENDAFVAWIVDAEADVVWQHSFAWANDAAIGFPKFIENRRNDAVMHVAGNEIIEFLEKICDLLVM